MGQGRKTHYLFIRVYARVSFLRQTRQVRHGILLVIMVLGTVLPLRIAVLALRITVLALRIAVLIGGNSSPYRGKLSGVGRKDAELAINESERGR